MIQQFYAILQQLSKDTDAFCTHNYSMTRAHILDNDCPQFRKLLQDCIKSLYMQEIQNATGIGMKG